MHPFERGTKVYIKEPFHMTKMAAMAINTQNVLIIFSRTGRLMILKLSMNHGGLSGSIMERSSLKFLRDYLDLFRSPMHLNGKN